MKETLQVLNNLKKRGIISDYAIGGAVASFFYLEATLTEDLDIFIHLESDKGGIIDLSPIFERLAEEGFQEFRQEGVVIGEWPVQFLPATTPLEKEALKFAEEETIEGETVRVFSAEYLMAICVQVGRAKDKIRLDQFLRDKSFDRTKLADILSQHSLTGKFEKIRKMLED